MGAGGNKDRTSVFLKKLSSVITNFPLLSLTTLLLVAS